MSTKRWQRLESIFVEAVTLPAGAREAFVSRAAAGDDSLRNEALRLLRAYDGSGEFLARPALDQLAHSIAADGWRLEPGQRIGAYTILRLLGAGGAGEVWRASDDRLGRDVAIKVLLPHHSSDVDHVRRFADEARTAGALNHPNILTVHDVGEHSGIPFLVSECLEGKSLRQRMEGGPLSTQEAITISLGIARGLAAAHARGIIHRDLKPENTFITQDGSVKILDFGLATLQSSLGQLPQDGGHLATGVIVGTAGYMAPEQVTGESVDARADLFALGVMLYEMLARKHPFRRGGTFETLNAVLSDDPPDLLTVNDQVPAPLAQVVARLLQRTPAARFQSALDLAWSLEQVAGGAPASARDGSHRSTPTAWRSARAVELIAASALTAAILGAGWWLLARPEAQPPSNGLVHFTWTLPPGLVLASAPVVSPDSRQIVFTGKDASGSRLYARAFNAREFTVIPGSERAEQPFWSPDSRSLGFFAGRRLMKLTWPGGAPIPVADAPAPRGGTWNGTDTILYAPDLVLAGLSRVGADGTRRERVTTLDSADGTTSHWWPSFFPDGVHFLYSVLSTNEGHRGVHLGRLDRPTGPSGPPLLGSSVQAIFVPLTDNRQGALLYVTDGRIEARRFDATRMALTPDASAIGLNAAGSTLYHPMLLSASADVLAYADAIVPWGHRLEAVGRHGEPLRRWEEPDAQNWPRISPDGRLIARQRVDRANNPDIWVEDLERGTRVRVTTAAEPDIQAVWSPDGQHLAYVSGNIPGRPGQRVLNISAADGTGIVRSIPCPATYCEPTDWTTEGWLLVNVIEAENHDVWIVPAKDGDSPRPLLTGAFAERDARMSPVHHWVAYQSNESGRSEVSVRTTQGPDRRITVSAAGGAQPVWRRDGLELFFVDPAGDLQSVAVRWTASGTPSFAAPVKLRVPPIGFGHWGTQYDVSPDGSRIYFLRRNEDPAPREIHIVLGWRTLLRD